MSLCVYCLFDVLDEIEVHQEQKFALASTFCARPFFVVAGTTGRNKLTTPSSCLEKHESSREREQQ